MCRRTSPLPCFAAESVYFFGNILGAPCDFNRSIDKSKAEFFIYLTYPIGDQRKENFHFFTFSIITSCNNQADHCFPFYRLRRPKRRGAGGVEKWPQPLTRCCHRNAFNRGPSPMIHLGTMPSPAFIRKARKKSRPFCGMPMKKGSP